MNIANNSKHILTTALMSFIDDEKQLQILNIAFRIAVSKNSTTIHLRLKP